MQLSAMTTQPSTMGTTSVPVTFESPKRTGSQAKMTTNPTEFRDVGVTDAMSSRSKPGGTSASTLIKRAESKEATTETTSSGLMGSLRTLGQQLKGAGQVLAEEAAVVGRNALARVNIQTRDNIRICPVPGVLPKEDFERIKNLVVEHPELFTRQDSFFRQGSAINAAELIRVGCGDIVEKLTTPAVLAKARAATGETNLEFYPKSDRNRLSLLYYSQPGDGIDWHVDGNVYMGKLWRGVLTIVEETADTTGKVEIVDQGEVQKFPKESLPNNLVLFQAAQMKHRVRAMNEGEQRMIVCMSFTDDARRSKNPLSNLYKSAVNYFFYGKFQQ